MPTKNPKEEKNFAISDYVPILRWLPKYTRFDGVSDFVAGITLGLTLIPQSIAYASLAGLTAQYGLYSCFMGGFIYVIFGTIKEVSMGPSSLMALITLEYTRNMPVDFVILLCFLAGCVELMMGMLNLGFVVDFISIPVTAGFTSATSVIIIIAQLQGLLGLRFKAQNILDNLYKIFEHHQNIRYADFALGVCSIIFLLTFRKLKDMDFPIGKARNRGSSTTAKKILWFLSISRNVLVISITATIAYNFERDGSAPFILSGKVESGLPRMALPPFSSQVGNETYTFFDMCAHYGPGIFVLPLVSVLANVAIAKAFACGKTVEATQEMLTLGLCNILGSFVSSMPTCGAFTRSAVSSASGVRSPMAGLYTGTMTLLALSFLTPYFYYIPRATLAAVLISAVIFMIDWRTMGLLVKGCKKDAVAAMVTFVVSIVCGVEIGLLLGALFNLVCFLKPSARPDIKTIQCKTESGDEYVILKPETGLFYPAADFFCNTVVRGVQKYGGNGAPLIIDCKRLRSLDYTALKGIEGISKDLNAEKNRLWLLNVSDDMIQSIEILTDKRHFRFIDDERKIPCIFFDDTVINHAEDDITSKLLKEYNESRARVENEKNIPCTNHNGRTEETSKENPSRSAAESQTHHQP